MHDAFGKVNNINTYNGYGRAYLQKDLSRYLGKRFKGSYLSDILQPMPARLDAFHLVSEGDKLTESEIGEDDPKDGLPVSLDQWIRREHLHCLKVDLRGTDLAWDVSRLLGVARVARQEHGKLGLQGLWLSIDPHEQCESPQYIVETLNKVREKDAETYEAIRHIEQPCRRDLHEHPLDVSPIAALKPVLIDESLTDVEDLKLATKLGYNGAVLGTCKGHSSSLLTAAECAQRGFACTVQDLGNPSIGLAHSVSLAAHLQSVKGVEISGRQFFPAVNEPLSRVHPGLIRLQDGKADTTMLGSFGLGYRWESLGISLESEQP